MLEEKIRVAREKLDESIITGKDYKEIYNLSVELDKLIAEYYMGKKENSKVEHKNV
ncbi:MAG: Spo0E family sporulation regulatory protein-aspartic acid phosphatase [Clostridia bacterium]|nr:Spo0E family sporulation regulatory protein-aspartic acid phosphatase [Clostridia bacterium]